QSYLYALRGGKAEFVCALPPIDPPEDLLGVVEGWLTAELDPTTPNRSVPPSGETTFSKSTSTDRGGSRSHLHSVVLASSIGGQSQIAAIAALQLTDMNAPRPEPAVIEILSDALIDHDDVDPATCVI
ncbi:MAG TPA: hypothetical protein VHZ95_11085, partial [Polyangiales bacterium]|nr:hypothetical protein [Polyangiales bacterium]